MSTAAVEMPIRLEAHDVRVEIAGTPILHGASLDVQSGELVAVVGPNGAGKSTLVRAIAGLQKMKDGKVRIGDADVRKLRGRKAARLRAFIPQRPRVPDGVRVIEALRIGRSPQVQPLRRLGRRDMDVIEEVMVRTRTMEFRDRFLSTLSGGELQRVQIAIGLAQEAPLLMADEPTSALDLGATSMVAKLMRQLADSGLGVLLVVHDLSLAAAIADRVVVMSEGRSVASGPPAEVLTEEILHEVWKVKAELHADDGGSTALRVSWLH